jgi:membrane protein required for colicin V production
MGSARYTSCMQTYDIVMLVVLVGTMLFGAWKGMAWQAASLASLLVSGFVAVHFSPIVAPHISSDQTWNRFLAMLLLYLGCSLAIWLAFRLVSKLIDKVKLKEYDRQLGALFGLAKGALLCIVITFFVVTLSEAGRQTVLVSYSGHAIAQLTRRAGPVLPEDVRAVVGKYVDELDHKLDPNTPPDAPKTPETPTGKGPEGLLKTVRQDTEQKLDVAQKKLDALEHLGQEVQDLSKDFQKTGEIEK